MPRSSSQPERTHAEEVCQHIYYVVRELREIQERELREIQENAAGYFNYCLELPDWVPKIVTKLNIETHYGGLAFLIKMVQMLCDLCKLIEEKGLDDSIIYNGRSREARRLADWWDDHKEEDSAR